MKKESHYTNPLHEQTRKIFLNDLEELKAKIKGKRRIYNNTMGYSEALVPVDAMIR
jgi:hypothetical protein